MKYNRAPLALLILSALSLQSYANDWTPLLDKELSQWEIWMGVPHSSVEGLPEGTYQDDNVHEGEPMGLNNDPKKVFTLQETGGELVLRISGEIYGGITTLAEHQNYHLRMKMKWGEKKWPPRVERKRDSGLLYHCYGEHGSFWKVWKSCLELQIQEHDMGDFIPLAGPRAELRGFRSDKGLFYSPNYPEYTKAKGYVKAAAEPDYPHGEWNTIELYTIGDIGIHVVNRTVVMVIKNAVTGEGAPLVKGQIQLQSEAAECYYKDIEIRPIQKFPEFILAKAKL